MRGMASCFLPPRRCFLPQAAKRRIRPRSELHFVEAGEPRYSKFDRLADATLVLAVVSGPFGSPRPPDSALVGSEQQSTTLPVA